MTREEFLKEIEKLNERFSGKKTRICVAGVSGKNDFVIICDGSVKYYTELFKESFETKEPVFLISSSKKSKVIINTNNIFEVTLVEEE